MHPSGGNNKKENSIKKTSFSHNYTIYYYIYVYTL